MSIPPNIAYADASFKSTGSTTSRTHGERAADLVNVRDFGAIGDGIADDTAACQRAIDAAFGGPTNPVLGGSLVPHGYANRTRNRALYFPNTAAAAFRLTNSLVFNHVYGGKIFGDNTFLSVTGSGSSPTAPTWIVNGMVETTIENLGFYSQNTSAANIDLDWDGNWDDLPVPDTNGLQHNIFSHIIGGTAQRGFHVAKSGNDGSFNTFQRVLISAVGIAGIHLDGANAIGNQAYGGCVGVTPAIGYWADGGSFSVIAGIGQGGTTTSIQIDSPYPCAILGGRMETGSTCIEMSAGLVTVKGMNFQDGGSTIVHATGGSITFDGCFAAPPAFGGALITGTAPAKLYIRGCGFAAVNLTGFTGTVEENI